MKINLTLAFIALCLGACVSGNPREGGLLGGIHGLQSHVYEERLQTRRQQLDSLRQQGGQAQQQSAQLHGQTQASQQQAAQLDRELVTLRQTQQYQQQEIAQLQQQIQTQEAERKKQQNRGGVVTFTSPASKLDVQRLQELIRQREILRKQIAEMVK